MSVNNSTANNSATPKPKISTTERVIKSKYSSSGLSSHFQTDKSKLREMSVEVCSLKVTVELYES